MLLFLFGFTEILLTDLKRSPTNSHLFRYENEIVAAANGRRQAAKFVNILKELTEKLPQNSFVTQPTFKNYQITRSVVENERVVVEYRKKDGQPFVIRAFLSGIKSLQAVTETILETWYNRVLSLRNSQHKDWVKPQPRNSNIAQKPLPDDVYKDLVETTKEGQVLGLPVCLKPEYRQNVLSIVQQSRGVLITDKKDSMPQNIKEILPSNPDHSLYFDILHTMKTSETLNFLGLQVHFTPDMVEALADVILENPNFSHLGIQDCGRIPYQGLYTLKRALEDRDEDDNYKNLSLEKLSQEVFEPKLDVTDLDLGPSSSSAKSTMDIYEILWKIEQRVNLKNLSMRNLIINWEDFDEIMNALPDDISNVTIENCQLPSLQNMHWNKFENLKSWKIKNCNLTSEDSNFIHNTLGISR